MTPSWPQLAQVDPKLAPRWPQVGPCWLMLVPSWPHDGPSPKVSPRLAKASTKALPLRAGPSKIGLAWQQRYEGLSMGFFNVLSRCYLAKACQGVHEGSALQGWPFQYWPGLAMTIRRAFKLTPKIAQLAPKTAKLASKIATLAPKMSCQAQLDVQDGQVGAQDGQVATQYDQVRP